MADEDRRRFRDEAERGGRALGGGAANGFGAVGRRGEGDESQGHSGYDDDRGGFVDDYRGGPGSGTVNPHRKRGSGFGAFGFNDDARQEGSHRGRGPRGYQRPDERILEDVSDRLTDDPHVDASEIEVRVENREVTLNGTVASRFEKRHAEDVAESVPGVAHVQNNLRVQQAGGGLDTVSATGAGGGQTGALLGPAGGPGGTGSIGGRRKQGAS
jgi:hypothetical protein